MERPLPIQHCCPPWGSLVGISSPARSYDWGEGNESMLGISWLLWKCSPKLTSHPTSNSWAEASQARSPNLQLSKIFLMTTINFWSRFLLSHGHFILFLNNLCWGDSKAWEWPAYILPICVVSFNSALDVFLGLNLKEHKELEILPDFQFK